jgi:hypothetical protein
MSKTWIGGDPNTPDYYIYVRTIEVENSLIKRILTNIKIRTEEKVSIITSLEFYKLNVDARKFYKGMTIGDVKKFGSENFKKELPRAEAQALSKLIGLPF